MRTRIMSLFALALLTPAVHAQTVIDFEDLLANYPEGFYNLAFKDPAIADFYSSSGMTMSATETLYFGAGLANGDPANFDIDGTNGPAFIALYSADPGGTMIFSFDGPVSLSIDLITSAVVPGDVPVNFLGLRDGKVVFSTNTIAPGASVGDPDGLATTFAFDDVIDQIQITTTNDSFRTVAFDNLVFESRVSCSPADLNEDGVLNFFDIAIFLGIFSLGCP